MQHINISIGCDHAAVVHKEAIIEYLKNEEYQVTNHGTDSTLSVDYPDYAHPVANDVIQGNSTFGILLCGSANGVCMTANKHKGIRAALCWKKEIAELARQHNNANIICLPARFMSIQEAIECVIVFLKTEFEGGRHQHRVEKIDM